MGFEYFMHGEEGLGGLDKGCFKTLKLFQVPDLAEILHCALLLRKSGIFAA